MTLRSGLVPFVLSVLSASVLVPTHAASAEPSPQGRAVAESSIDTPYEFPVVPGSPEWAAFDTHDEMLAATQVPADVLERMTTEALVETVLDYPLMIDTYAYNSPQEGQDAFRRQFNGYAELTERADAGEELLAVYDRLDPRRVAARASRNPAGGAAMRYSQVEMLLAQRQVLRTLSTKDRRRAITVGARNLTGIKDSFDVLGMTARNSNATLVGRAVGKRRLARHLAQRDAGTVRQFLRTGGLSKSEQRATWLIESAVAGTTVPAVALRDSASTVYTPNGSSVAAITRSPELTSAEKTAINQQIKAAYPNATRERTASRLYNCHSYAFYSQATSNNRWINSASKYVSDGSYVLTSNFRRVGARQRWLSGDHSSIIASSAYDRSKWGTAGLYLHSPSYSPYAGGPTGPYERS